MRLTSSTEPAAASWLDRPEPRAQQLVAGENVQRQIAVAVVIAMKEPLRLMAVERDVGRVQIEHDLLRRRGVRFQVEVRQQPVHRLGRIADLVIAQTAAGQLQPVQRALAGQRLIQFPLAAQKPQQRDPERSFARDRKGLRSPAPAHRCAAPASPTNGA